MDDDLSPRPAILPYLDALVLRWRVALSGRGIRSRYRVAVSGQGSSSGRDGDGKERLSRPLKGCGISLWAWGLGLGVGFTFIFRCYCVLIS